MTANGTYVDGTPFSVSGAMNGNNDSHGTHVGGTLGASRDGAACTVAYGTAAHENEGYTNPGQGHGMVHKTTPKIDWNEVQ